MPFLSRIEEEAIALGTEHGLQLGRTEEMRNTTRRNLMMILSIKFGELPSEIIDTLSGISDLSVLENLLSQSVTINSLQDFQNLLQ